LVARGDSGMKRSEVRRMSGPLAWSRVGRLEGLGVSTVR
jgi:hypothetical protein